ncbi:hypothetical protein [Streptomyces venezuelae]|nr:hypothetical protein [Streptomyces venezuelae]
MQRLPLTSNNSKLGEGSIFGQVTAITHPVSISPAYSASTGPLPTH